MKKLVASTASVVFLALFLAALTLQFTKRTFAKPSSPDLERRSRAIALLRTINTAEVGERSQYGSYQSWEAMLAHQPKFFAKFLGMNYPREANVRFADLPEILPGWSLRFKVHADGLGYDVRLQDLKDQECLYAAVTDESGLIRQSKVIDCKIQ